MASTTPQSWIAQGQVQFARTLKSVLDMQRQLGERQSAAALELLHAQLGVFQPSTISAARDLLDVQADLLGGFATQWKGMLDNLVERSGACIGDLRQARDRDEMVGVLALFASDMSERLHADAERAGSLLGSASEAGKVLVARTLDGMIDAGDDSQQGGGDKPPAA